MSTMAQALRSAASRPLLAMTLVSLCALSCSALAASDAPSCGNLPSSLPVPDGLLSKDEWQTSSMIPLELGLGQVKTQDEISVSSMLLQHTKTAGSVAFVVRRPG